MLKHNDIKDEFKISAVSDSGLLSNGYKESFKRIKSPSIKSFGVDSFPLKICTASMYGTQTTFIPKFMFGGIPGRMFAGIEMLDKCIENQFTDMSLRIADRQMKYNNKDHNCIFGLDTGIEPGDFSFISKLDMRAPKSNMDFDGTSWFIAKTDKKTHKYTKNGVAGIFNKHNGLKEKTPAMVSGLFKALNINKAGL